MLYIHLFDMSVNVGNIADQEFTSDHPEPVEVSNEVSSQSVS